MVVVHTNVLAYLLIDGNRIAADFASSAYDARFIAAAQTLSAKLVTEDARLRAAVPALTVTLADARGD